ncbi:hypothetical protein W97_07327 [Coniosporium apollinis CBS 100218]|uniref:NAD(P)-binding domain-containing protein n=1 Tax=Coniosporium apollinis (strain CBS 100218) TaxID=1168221 RepID=R7Z263_CONA1|nr:uncharacterized protein W97_07327 [Coniosporium apollinis CBS 100218]EON68178.1 hypothetical protein W97_07327 [Coniosporium apollinis CBS 100218]
MTTAVLAGSTGLVGSNILQTLLSDPSIAHTHAYTRRPLPTTSPNLTPLLSADHSTWPSLFPHPSGPSLFLSALGTTRANAGSFEAQHKIDVELNLSLARAAKDAGVQIYVLISSAGASSSSFFPYPRMKAELEDAIKALGFEHTVILRPGLIVGDREDSRPAEWGVRKIAGLAGALTGGWGKDFWAQDASVIARAGVRAGMECVEGRREKGVWVLGQGDIVRMGKEEKK